MYPYSSLLMVFFEALTSFEAGYTTPFGIVLGFPSDRAFFFGRIGNLLLIVPLLLLLGPVSEFLRSKSALMERFIRWFFDRTRQNDSLIARREVYALYLFGAIPPLGARVWSYGAIAFVFNIECKLEFVAISTCAGAAALITTLQSHILINLFEAVQ